MAEEANFNLLYNTFSSTNALSLIVGWRMAQKSPTRIVEEYKKSEVKFVGLFVSEAISHLNGGADGAIWRSINGKQVSQEEKFIEERSRKRILHILLRTSLPKRLKF